MKVDFEEFEKQRKESIIKSGEYCKAEILIGTNDETPIIDVEINKVSAYEIALLLVALKKTCESLEMKFPEIKNIIKDLKFNSYEIKNNNNENI